MGTTQKYAMCDPCAEVPSTSGLVVEYIVAIDVTRARFPAGAKEQYGKAQHSAKLL